MEELAKADVDARSEEARTAANDEVCYTGGFKPRGLQSFAGNRMSQTKGLFLVNGHSLRGSRKRLQVPPPGEKLEILRVRPGKIRKNTLPRPNSTLRNDTVQKSGPVFEFPGWAVMLQNLAQESGEYVWRRAVRGDASRESNQMRSIPGGSHIPAIIIDHLRQEQISFYVFESLLVSQVRRYHLSPSETPERLIQENPRPPPIPETASKDLRLHLSNHGGSNLD